MAHLVFGVLFLEDVRRYRERLLSDTGLTPVFPLWHRPTDTLARTMVASGLRAVVSCVDPRQLDPSFAGSLYDARFPDHVPAAVDPCDERGEFHPFACAGPGFRRSLPIVPGEVVERDGFVCCDVLEPVAAGTETSGGARRD